MSLGCGGAPKEDSTGSNAQAIKPSGNLVVSVEVDNEGSWATVFEEVPWGGVAYVTRLDGVMEVELTGSRFAPEGKYRIDDRGLLRGFQDGDSSSEPLTLDDASWGGGFYGVLLQDWLAPFSDAPVFGVIAGITRGGGSPDAGRLVLPDRDQVRSSDATRRSSYPIRPIRLKKGDAFFLAHNYPVRGHFAGKYSNSEASIQYSVNLVPMEDTSSVEVSSREIQLKTPGRGQSSSREPKTKYGLRHVWIPSRNLHESGFWIGETEFTRRAVKIWIEGERYRWEQGRDELESEKDREKAWREHSQYFLTNDRRVDDDSFPATLDEDLVKRICQAIGGRLPFTHEWMWAASGGDESGKYPWGDEHPVNRKNAFNGAMTRNGHHERVRVGSYPPNGFGLYDVIGNVGEFTVELRRSSDGRSEEKIQLVGYTGSRSGVVPIQVRTTNTAAVSFGFRCVIDP
jgi:formylglycine-generating enzyme required for sulfatase activity